MKALRIKLPIAASTILLLAPLFAAAGPLGTAFTYQGRLTDSGGPATGLYDFQFVLCDAATNGAALGTNTVAAAPVANGLYTVALDFGANAFDGNARWLALSVRTNGASAWSALSPRLGLTPTPYAIRATTAGGVSGVIPDSQLSANIARLNGTNVFTTSVTAPSFSGSGSSLSGIAPASGSSNYVAKGGDTMTGTLSLPRNGLVAGGNQLVLSGGNVGIGTTSPEGKLHIASDLADSPQLLHLTHAQAIEQILELPDGAPNAKYWRWDASAADNTLSGSLMNDNATVSTPWMTVQRNGYAVAGVSFPNGNVGIGTPSPLDRLQVSGGSLSARGLSATDGYVALNAGGPDAAGYIDFFKNGPTRIAFLGYKYAGPNNLNLRLENSASFQITGGDVGMTGTLSLPANGLAAGGTQLVLSGGNVGIGTGNPSAPVHVLNSSYNPLILERIGGGKWSALLTSDPAGDSSAPFNFNSLTLRSEAPSADFGIRAGDIGNPQFVVRTTGNVGIGTASPDASLNVDGHVHIGKQQAFDNTGAWDKSVLVDGTYNARIRIRASNYTFGDVETSLYADSSESISSGIRSTHPFQISAVGNILLVGGNVGIGTTTPSTKLEVAGSLKVSGAGSSITTPVLSITGGSDVAEPFPMNTGDIPKGAVVIIDDERPGGVKLSERAYDTRVAGIVSGANGVHPGVTLSQQGLLDGGGNVALSGRVYALADADKGPIKPGDLLTTSTTPGHAMKVGDQAKAQGAILGKAMSALPKGRGYVLVLVTLQ